MSSALSLAERAHLVGSAQAKFDAIRVDYPPQTSAMAILDEVRIAGLYRTPGSVCGGAMMVAPHGAGKTEAVRGLRRILSQSAAEGEIPLLHVYIDTAGTTESVPTSILQALGAARPEAGSEKTRWPRVTSEIIDRRVQLIVFDEFNRASRRPSMSAPIATIIRQKIMDSGLAPVVFVGSENAASVLSQVPELRERLDDSADLRPMNWHLEGDRALFIDFAADLDRAMVDLGIVACEAGLGEKAFAKPLWEASDGRLRRIIKIVRQAMTSALRDGRDHIDRDDLAYAVDDYAITNGFCERNPFASGSV